VVAVKLFTAIIDPTRAHSDARDRQDRYLRALRTLPKMQIILGNFQPREVTCAATCKEKYFIAEEKKTDVNMAVELMSDAIQNAVESVVVVSGDSDLQPAVQWVRKNRNAIKITVYIPALPKEQDVRRADFYKKLDIQCRFLPLIDLGNYQLPGLVKLSDGKFVCRPHLWKKQG